jgi:hypothetical protein
MTPNELDALLTRTEQRKGDHDVPPDVENLLDDLVAALREAQAEVARLRHPDLRIVYGYEAGAGDLEAVEAERDEWRVAAERAWDIEMERTRQRDAWARTSQELTAMLDEARAAIDRVRALCENTRIMVSTPPADCTMHCLDAPCDCSGKYRAMGWDLDPAAVHTALDGRDHRTKD